MLTIIPITQRKANLFVKYIHDHHKPVVGSIFQIGCELDGVLVGVIIVGRPVSRMIDQTRDTLEVLRMCSDKETKNVCSKLYAAAWKATKALGWKRLITYTLQREDSISVIAAGWRYIGPAGGGSWNRSSRARTDKHPTEKKKLFEAV